jgi:hypothetical protein
MNPSLIPSSTIQMQRRFQMATSIFRFDVCFHQPVPSSLFKKYFSLSPLLIPFGTLIIIIECIWEATG